MDHPVAHVAAIGSLALTLVGWLPPLVSLLAATWYGLLIYDRLRKGPRT